MPLSNGARARFRRDDHIDRLHEQEARWFALRVGHKKERVAIRLLDRDGIRAWSPFYTEKRQYAKTGEREVKLAVLPGYVFVKITKSDERTVLQNPYVFRFVRIGRDRYDLPNSDMSLLRRMSLDRQLKWKLCEAAESWQPGLAVSLIGGGMTGLCGELIGRKNGQIFVVKIEAIGRSLEVEVDGRYLRVEPT
ncbi:MAG: transcription termination/antitermination NusG family protein [Bacteroidota bacterium]